MKLVVDTNVVLSGLLWGGPPNRVLILARDGLLSILNCEETAAELRKVLQYERFSKRLEQLSTSPDEVLAYYMNLATFVPTPQSIPDVIPEDPFDNIFVALAAENDAHLIVSGDKHLRTIEAYQGIPIVSPSEACRVIDSVRGE